MKKNCFILLISCFVAFGFSSCSSTDTTWRDSNLAFFDNLKNREGIHEIGDSINGYPGLYYEVLKESTSDTIPIIGNKVLVSYDGWLFNDTIKYDSKHILLRTEAFEYNDNYPLTVGNDAIVGWNLILQHMPVGAKWRVYIPYYLGYGSSAQTNIPAYSTLIFDITLRKIVSQN